MASPHAPFALLAPPQLVLAPARDDAPPSAVDLFAGMPPGTTPALVRLAAGPSRAAERAAEALQRALAAEARAFAAAVTESHPADADAARALLDAARADRAWAKLLVLVGDDAAAMPAESLWTDWLARGAGHAVMVALPLGPKGTDAARALPESLGHINVAWWSLDVGELATEVLDVAGVVAEDRRVFVSYRRTDALEIAEQLFEELPKHRFDVFVDRFRVPPGRDFQERLTDELAHKSMILVLESPDLPESKWIEHELTFAQEHGLGRVALWLPGPNLVDPSKPRPGVPWIDEEYRLRLGRDDLDPPADRVTAASRLTADAVRRLARRLAEEHGRSLARRRGYLLDAVRAALAMRGVTDQRLDQRGHLHVRVPKAGEPVLEYVVWAAPRPPEIAEFRTAYDVCQPGPHPAGAVITAALFRDTRRREGLAWLAGRSLVKLADAGRIADLADAIAARRALP